MSEEDTVIRFISSWQTTCNWC